MYYRHARPGDAAALAAFAAASFIESYRDQSDVAELEAYAEQNFTTAQIAREVADPFARFLLAEQDSGICGYALLELDSAPDCELLAIKPAHLSRIYVASQWHGRGIARELLGRCFAEARAADCDVVWLAVWDANPRAIRFYLKSGFQIVGEQPFIMGADTQRDFVMAWPGVAK